MRDENRIIGIRAENVSFFFSFQGQISISGSLGLAFPSKFGGMLVPGRGGMETLSKPSPTFYGAYPNISMHQKWD